MPRFQNMVPGQQRVVYVRPRSRRKRRKLRWELLTIPLSLIIAFWFLHHIQPSVNIEAWMDYMQIENRERYRQLFMLCVIGIAICLVFRIYRKPPKDE